MERRESRATQLVHHSEMTLPKRERGSLFCAARLRNIARVCRRRRIISTQRSYAHRAASQANTNAQSKRTPRLPRSLTPRSRRTGRRTKKHEVDVLAVGSRGCSRCGASSRRRLRRAKWWLRTCGGGSGGCVGLGGGGRVILNKELKIVLEFSTIW